MLRSYGEKRTLVVVRERKNRRFLALVITTEQISGAEVED